ncbi:hypothetical protein H0H81_006626 [Sphagnurus paluster]|uniref:Uncharacterized protein n=1 Tax=Sphagnurus paluster TaxID=117069 RepID=A0A9P7FSB5_9AGAR|nr:hypothetical protein H0H81_004111 [Sphagnurus paluster]KAG5649062.1 hypothetical protein H0H81_006626 [Sphagnurus paluster]
MLQLDTQERVYSPLSDLSSLVLVVSAPERGVPLLDSYSSVVIKRDDEARELDWKHHAASDSGELV